MVGPPGGCSRRKGATMRQRSGRDAVAPSGQQEPAAPVAGRRLLSSLHGHGAHDRCSREAVVPPPGSGASALPRMRSSARNPSGRSRSRESDRDRFCRRAGGRLAARPALPRLRFHDVADPDAAVALASALVPSSDSTGDGGQVCMDNAEVPRRFASTPDSATCPPTDRSYERPAELVAEPRAPATSVPRRGSARSLATKTLRPPTTPASDSPTTGSGGRARGCRERSVDCSAPCVGSGAVPRHRLVANEVARPRGEGDGMRSSGRRGQRDRVLRRKASRRWGC